MTKKHTVVYNRTKWAQFISCICPQILGAISPRQFRKYAQMPSRDELRLVWTSLRPAAPGTLVVNPHFKEN